MSSDVMRHIRDKLYETLNTNLREKLVGWKTVYFEFVHLCRGDHLYVVLLIPFISTAGFA